MRSRDCPPGESRYGTQTSTHFLFFRPKSSEIRTPLANKVVIMTSVCGRDFGNWPFLSAGVMQHVCVCVCVSGTQRFKVISAARFHLTIQHSRLPQAGMRRYARARWPECNCCTPTFKTRDKRNESGPFRPQTGGAP